MNLRFDQTLQFGLFLSVQSLSRVTSRAPTIYELC
jgi:hypothetical protein